MNEQTWCVWSRYGWCALKINEKPADNGTVGRQTKCGMFITLPWGTAFRDPDCEACLRHSRHSDTSRETTNEPFNKCKQDVILVVKQTTSSEEIAAYIREGLIPEGAREETCEEFFARGRVSDCDCKLLQCVCVQARPHDKNCQFRVALTCAIPIACEEHGYDVCPICDICTCGRPILEK